MIYTTGELGKAFGLSRSALIYYDKLVLLRPSVRSQGNYRQYTERDYQKSAKSMTYRATGMSLICSVVARSKPHSLATSVLPRSNSALIIGGLFLLQLLGMGNINLNRWRKKAMH